MSPDFCIEVVIEDSSFGTFKGIKLGDLFEVRSKLSLRNRKY